MNLLLKGFPREPRDNWQKQTPGEIDIEPKQRDPGSLTRITEDRFKQQERKRKKEFLPVGGWLISLSATHSSSIPLHGRLLFLTRVRCFPSSQEKYKRGSFKTQQNSIKMNLNESHLETVTLCLVFIRGSSSAQETHLAQMLQREKPT